MSRRFFPIAAGGARAGAAAGGRLHPLPHQVGQGSPKFDAAKAKVYFRRVCDKVSELVKDTVRRWDDAGL